MLEAWIHTGMSAPHAMASTPVAVPEPAELLMLAAGVGFLAVVNRRRCAPAVEEW
jgi:hypothetical protein